MNGGRETVNVTREAFEKMGIIGGAVLGGPLTK